MSAPTLRARNAETAPKMAFVYGSNVNLAHLDVWCVERGYGSGLFRCVGGAMMPDTALVFNLHSRSRGGGVLNLRFQRGNLLQGLLLEPTEEGWRALDHKEGVGSGAYRRVTRNVVNQDGRMTPVVTYAGEPRAEGRFCPPAPGYVETVLAGYDKFEWLHQPVLDAAAGKRSASNTDGVFVYGTLLRGEQRAHVITRHNPSCILLAETPGLLADLASFPAMLLWDKQRGELVVVHGEFVRFPDVEVALGELDAIEGAKPFGEAGGFYRRTLISVGVGDGRERFAWVYVMGDHQVLTKSIIRSGCWREHQGHRHAAIRAIAEAHAGRTPNFFKALDAEARYVCASEVPPPFALTVDGVAKALASGEVSERKVARCSEDGAVKIPLCNAADA